MMNDVQPEGAKRTPLHDDHITRGARMFEFGGWLMPLHYSGVIEEHRAVRESLGVFDICHMGQIFVSGPEALRWLNEMLSNNVERLDVGESQYTLLLNDDGGIIDDLIIYRHADGKYLLVVNAATTERDFEWLQAHLQPGLSIENRSVDFAGLAIQGPKSAKLFDLFFGDTNSRPARNEIKQIKCDLMKFYISSTGYTGEDGFEVFFPAENAPEVWNRILEKGQELGIKPCGLGARDTLRLEMCYPLNGSDLSTEYTPLEAGLSIFVDLQKEKFVGREALLRQRESGIKRRLVPFKMRDKGPPPRPRYSLFKEDRQIGEITSGTISPSMNIGIGMAYIPTEFARIAEDIDVEIRGKRFPAKIEKKPLHRKYS